MHNPRSYVNGFTSRLNNTVKNKYRSSVSQQRNNFTVDSRIGSYSIVYTSTDYMKIIWKNGDKQIEARHVEYPYWSWQVKIRKENGEVARTVTGLDNTRQVEAFVKMFVYHDVILTDVIQFNHGYENRNSHTRLTTCLVSSSSVIEGVITYLREEELLTRDQAIKRIKLGRVK